MRCDECGYQLGSQGHRVSCREAGAESHGRWLRDEIARKESELADLRHRRDLVIKELNTEEGATARDIGYIVGLSHVRVREVINGQGYHQRNKITSG